MAQGQTYAASEKPNKKGVWYTGTDTLKEGYALCFNHDSTTGAAASAEDFNRMYEVEKPATANLPSFAGVVAQGHGGKTGPCFIEVEQPTVVGRAVRMWTDQNCTILTTKLALTGGTYALQAAGAAAKTVGEALQTVNRSSTAGTVLAKFGGTPMVAVVTPTAATLTGTTTGGTAAVAFTATTSARLAAPAGGTTGGTFACANLPGSGYSAGEVAVIEGYATKLVDFCTAMRTDVATVMANVKRVGKATAANTTAIASLITALKSAGIMDVS